jgi:hypothetical protein
VRDDVEMDLVTHDLRKFVRLMLRRNGYAGAGRGQGRAGA